MAASKATLSLTSSGAVCLNPPLIAGYRQRQTSLFPPVLVAVCPFADEVVDAPLTVLADDLFRVAIADTCRAVRDVLTVTSNDMGN